MKLRKRAPLGSTDMMAGLATATGWFQRDATVPRHIVYVGDVAELKRIEADGVMLRIGAAASLEDAWGALAARNEKGELDGTSRRAIEAEIDQVRDMTLDMLRGLE